MKTRLHFFNAIITSMVLLLGYTSSMEAFFPNDFCLWRCELLNLILYAQTKPGARWNGRKSPLRGREARGAQRSSLPVTPGNSIPQPGQSPRFTIEGLV